MALDIFDINSANKEQQVTDRFLSRFRGGNRSAALMGLVSEAVSGMLDRPAPAAPRPSIPSPATASAMGADRTMQFMQMQNQQAQAEAQRQLEAERIRMQEEASEKARQQQLKLEQLRMKNQIGMEKFRIESQQKLQELEIQRQQQAEERKKLEPFELEDGLIVQRSPDGSIMPVYESPLYKQRQETSRAQQVAAQMRAASAGRGGGGGGGGTNVSMQDWDAEKRVWNPVTLAWDTVKTRIGYHPRFNRALPVLDESGKPFTITIPGVPEYVQITDERGTFMYPKGPDGRPILNVPPVTAAQARAAGGAVPSPLRDDAVVQEGRDPGFRIAPASRSQGTQRLSPLQAAQADQAAYESLSKEIQDKYKVDADGVLRDKNDDSIAPSAVLDQFASAVRNAEARITNNSQPNRMPSPEALQALEGILGDFGEM